MRRIPGTFDFMMGRFVVQCVIFVGLLTFFTADALMCYQCSGTSFESPCIHDIEALTNASRGLNELFSKNCTDANNRWDRCVIEKHKKSGNYVFFKRGCHDGKYFRKDVNDTEFQSLKPNNDTTCAFITTKAVCFTFCDTDYCNGPQYVEDPCSDTFRNENGTLPLGCGARGFHNNNLIWLMQLLVLTITVCGLSWITLTGGSV